jgi:hypothetical protein
MCRPSAAKFVQEHDLLLAEVICQLYNSNLHCQSCGRKSAPDANTFARDQGGINSEGLYYRKYTCKNKKNGPVGQRCSNTISVKSMIKLAVEDLGPATVARLREILGLPFEPPVPAPRGPRKSFIATPKTTSFSSSTSQPKRKQQDVTGQTPVSKRVDQRPTPHRSESKPLDLESLYRTLQSVYIQADSVQFNIRSAMSELEGLKKHIVTVEKLLRMSLYIHF